MEKERDGQVYDGLEAVIFAIAITRPPHVFVIEPQQTAHINWSTNRTIYTPKDVGPILLETLFKHYFAEIKNSTGKDSKEKVDGRSLLRQNDLLYDEVFTVAKAFMETATLHTVEELQRFSNAKTPSPPWIHVVKLTVPMVCCDEAATRLIEALGGEDVAKRVVGGVKWWQVRGLQGIDAEWISTKKDYEIAKKRRKERSQREASLEAQKEDDTESDQQTPVYEPEMDAMRCILYLHGGGYYFGSIDQERYGLQRLARKISGRVFAIKYRLAPQYPFPCAIQDALAAYLFLIRPPPGASHRPVRPSHIVIAGDSAGGGLTLAVLQVIRDSGLPLPAGGILISPWCDLTHSFPSIHTNTEKDIVPPSGLAFHKPSVLWPPPPDELVHSVHEGIRQRIRKLTSIYSNSSTANLSALAGQAESRVTEEIKWYKFKRVGQRRTKSTTVIDGANENSAESSPTEAAKPDKSPVSDASQGTGRKVSLPPADREAGQTITLKSSEGETLVIKDQIQLYAPNNLLGHPLVSAVLGHLGNLPPLLVIAGEDEVLRDETLYLAHKAANPHAYPIKEKVKDMYPVLKGLKDIRPTQVHLQVYDDAPHCLPVIFPFTEPSKYCYRSMASFCKYVTGILGPSETESDLNNSNRSSLALEAVTATNGDQGDAIFDERIVASPSTEAPSEPQIDDNRNSADSYTAEHPKQPKSNGISHSLLRTHSEKLKSRLLERLEPRRGPRSSLAEPRSDSLFRRVLYDRAASSFGAERLEKKSERLAGDSSIYIDISDTSPFRNNMIRERVATNGVIRDLEPENELIACQQAPEDIGIVSEKATKRYLKAAKFYNEKFASHYKHVAKRRAHNLDLARKTDTIRNVEQLQMHFFQNASDTERNRIHLHHDAKSIQTGLEKSAASWSWAWAFDADERPPPSSIVSRRDTQEARRLSRIADQPTNASEDHISGNSLWTVMINMLTPEQGSNGVKQKDRDRPEKRHVHSFFLPKKPSQS